MDKEDEEQMELAKKEKAAKLTDKNKDVAK